MSRRDRWTLHVPCTHAGCGEVTRYTYDTAKERAESFELKNKPFYKCLRHRAPHEVLGPNNLATRKEIEVIRDNSLAQNFFKDGENVVSGFQYGNGYKAYADDFPAGSKIVITTQVTLPTL